MGFLIPHENIKYSQMGRWFAAKLNTVTILGLLSFVKMPQTSVAVYLSKEKSKDRPSTVGGATAWDALTPYQGARLNPGHFLLRI